MGDTALHRKIDIYVRGEYVCSTKQAANVSEAKRKFLKDPSYVTVGSSGLTRVRLEDVGAYEVKCVYAAEA